MTMTMFKSLKCLKVTFIANI